MHQHASPLLRTEAHGQLVLVEDGVGRFSAEGPGGGESTADDRRPGPVRHPVVPALGEQDALARQAQVGLWIRGPAHATASRRRGTARPGGWMTRPPWSRRLLAVGGACRPALGITRDRQDIGDQGPRRRHRAALGDRDRSIREPSRLRRPSDRRNDDGGYPRVDFAAAQVGPAPRRRGERGPVLRRDLDRAAGRAGGAPPCRARADGGGSRPPCRCRRGGSRQPSGAGGVGWELSAPLANRFCHLDWAVDGRAVADGLSGGWPAPRIPVLTDGWERWIGVAAAGWVASSGRDPRWPSRSPNDAATAGRAWPSPRKLGHGGDAARCRAPAGTDDLVRSLLVRGAVGQGPGIELLTWLAEADLPDPEEVLADPESFVLPERGNRALAALSSVASAVAARPTLERWQQGWGRLRSGRR